MMAVDHYLAIIKPYQYTFLLNKRNGIIIIVIMWCVALVGGFINFFTGIGSFKDNEKAVAVKGFNGSCKTFESR
jgi:hypothetical protein